MAVFSIRKSFEHVFALGCALFAGLFLSGGSLQAQTPLEQFKAFLTNPPPIEEIVFERKILIAMPTPPGMTNMVPAGSFFQLRLQTNAYFLRQSDVIGAAPQNHRGGNLLEGEWNDAYWKLNGDQLDLWPDKKLARLKREVERSMIVETISGLGLEMRVISGLGLEMRLTPSSIVWKGDTFTARGTDGSQFEGRIESKTVTGLPERIVFWTDQDPGLHYGVDYKFRMTFHPWFPISIKPFLKRGKSENRYQEFYVRSVKMGSVTSQENFFPTLFTNANTMTILHTKAGLEFFGRNGKLTLASTSPPPPRTNNVPPSSSASPTNAPLPATPPPSNAPPSANKALSPPPSPPPSTILLVAALLFLSIPLLMFLFFTIRANKRDAR